jgi:membrane protease YdiL (CAAX protease family)
MKEIKEMFWVMAFFALVMLIPAGAWKAFDFLGFKLKLVAWAAYYIIFTAALAENFLRKRGLAWNDIGLGLGGSVWRAALLGLAGAVFSVGAGWFGCEVLGFKEAGNSSLVELVLKHMSGGGWNARLFLAWFMFPIALCEEIVFRGIIFSYLEKRKGFIVALLVSSLMFALVHGTPVRMAYTFIFGLVWGSVFRLGRGLTSSVTAHYLHNIAAFYL